MVLSIVSKTIMLRLNERRKKHSVAALVETTFAAGISPDLNLVESEQDGDDESKCFGASDLSISVTSDSETNPDRSEAKHFNSESSSVFSPGMKHLRESSPVFSPVQFLSESSSPVKCLSESMTHLSESTYSGVFSPMKRLSESSSVFSPTPSDLDSPDGPLGSSRHSKLKFFAALLHRRRSAPGAKPDKLVTAEQGRNKSPRISFSPVRIIVSTSGDDSAANLKRSRGYVSTGNLLSCSMEMKPNTLKRHLGKSLENVSGFVVCLKAVLWNNYVYKSGVWLRGFLCVGGH